MVHSDLEPFGGPKLFAIEILVYYLVRSISEILAVKWHAHDEEACTEHQLLLGELGLALYGAIGRMDLT